MNIQTKIKLAKSLLAGFRKNKSAFTLIELMVTLVMIGAAIVCIGAIIFLIVLACHFLPKVW